GMYHSKRALTFQTEEDRNKAIDAIWDPRHELYRMPNAPADTLTMIVPEDAVPLLRALDLQFADYPVVPFQRGTNRPSDSNVA
ncbi:MAG TPA: hypothetical protein PK867_16705, partial [Pirellulales bacterium]|nr:hypothetical protein [Pirellulales bacterium]